jgi:large conductance mechanosensitive channel
LAGQAASLPLAEAKKLGAVFAYGSFVTVALNFFILAFVIFVMVRQINRLKTTQKTEAVPEATPITPEDVLLLREIRDSLKNKA